MTLRFTMKETAYAGQVVELDQATGMLRPVETLKNGLHCQWCLENGESEFYPTLELLRQHTTEVHPGRSLWFKHTKPTNEEHIRLNQDEWTACDQHCTATNHCEAAHTVIRRKPATQTAKPLRQIEGCSPYYDVHGGPIKCKAHPGVEFTESHFIANINNVRFEEPEPTSVEVYREMCKHDPITKALKATVERMFDEVLERAITQVEEEEKRCPACTSGIRGLHHSTAVDENGCHTTPDGSCVSSGPCLHTKIPAPPPARPDEHLIGEIEKPHASRNFDNASSSDWSPFGTHANHNDPDSPCSYGGPLEFSQTAEDGLPNWERHKDCPASIAITFSKPVSQSEERHPFVGKTCEHGYVSPHSYMPKPPRIGVTAECPGPISENSREPVDFKELRSLSERLWKTYCPRTDGKCDECGGSRTWPYTDLELVRPWHKRTCSWRRTTSEWFTTVHDTFEIQKSRETDNAQD